VPSTPIKPINFPFWVPEGARATLNTYYDLTYSERDHRYMLQRLAKHHSMQEAWTRLISFEKITPDVLVTLTFVIWLSARRMGHLGSKSRLRRARKKLSEPPAYSEITRQAHVIAETVEALDPQIRAANEITNVTLQELRRVADFFKREDESINLWLGIAPLPRKLGARNADQIAFVNRMCGLPWSPTGSRRQPYSLVAILTNVAFDLPEKKEWNADQVKHCYASRSRSK
jgi:hypothetical protein